MSISRRDLIIKSALALPATGVLRGSVTSSSSPNVTRPSDPNVEARGVWVHTEHDKYGIGFDADETKGKEQIRATVQKFADLHLNLVLPWTSTGYLVALENSEYQEAHPTARWDALGYLIREATKHGLAVHLWYAPTEYRDASWPDFDPKVGGNPKWAARRIDELVPNYPIAKKDDQEPQWLMNAVKTPLPPEKPMHDICPQHAAARAWQRQLLTKALDRYPELSGIHLEEPGYTYPGNCVCDLCQTVFQQLYQEPLVEHINSLEAQDFRCLGTSAFVAALYRMIRTRNLGLQLSANASVDWRWDERILGRDWPHWARLGWLDYYVPQDYTTNLDAYRRQLSLTMKDLGEACPVYAGIGISWGDHPTTIPPQLVVRQIEVARELGASGVVLFPAEGINDELEEALLKGPFRFAAKLPLIDHTLSPIRKSYESAE
jgi:uncharacterized lipoprotein YddW (UPF0748 family)